jgi:hypothetical protein
LLVWAANSSQRQVMQSRNAEVTRKEAHRIVSLLACGFDPDRPERALIADVLERPNVIRALFLAAEALDGDLNRAETIAEPRMGKPWTKDEDDELRYETAQNESLGIISSRHQRSEGGIIARMVHLKIVEDRNAARTFFRCKKSI